MLHVMATMREVGAEPIPGYRLVEPLGEGGFGEVWKCEAPGGLFKAIKFVGQGSAGASPAAQEQAALKRVKDIRHPFILSLERVEEIDGVLLVIMELADRNLLAVHEEYRERGLPGLPRDELLHYLMEAAEALDHMNEKYDLQHLDIKPHNLFLVSNHIKVADFGLVSGLPESEGAPQRQGGITPLYASPEILRGTVSRRSDQYSLAIVYQQMLTGTLPFRSSTVYDLVSQHLSAEPDLTSLPASDRPAVARALAKVPADRFPSCQDFVQALLGLEPAPSPGRSSGMWRRVVIPPRQPAKPEAGAVTKAQGPLPRENDQRTRLVASGVDGEGWRVEGEEKSCPPPSTLPPPPPGPVGRPATTGGAASEPTSVSLPGYRFLQCLAQSPLGDRWRAQNGEGQERRALCLLSFVGYDERLIMHLRALRHPALPATEVQWSPAQRLVLLTDCYDQTLRDRFEQCQAAGQSGIPRAELLGYLRTAAEALDALQQEHGLRHLALSPRSLLVQNERLWLADFGLIQLVWLPTGQLAGPLNPRYAAPELFQAGADLANASGWCAAGADLANASGWCAAGDYAAADQFSLALIYAEMLTGAQARPQRPTSGLHRRPGGVAWSGDHATTGAGRPMPQHGGQANRSPRIDLDLLSPADRQVIARALEPSPDKRYRSCRALVDALERAGVGSAPPEDLYGTLPSVVPFASLFGEAPPAHLVLPSISSLVALLTAGSSPQEVAGPQNVRYHVHADGTWEYRCPIQVFPGALRLKVDGFRQHWNARLIAEEGDTYRFIIDLPSARRFWERAVAQPRRLAVDLELAGRWAHDDGLRSHKMEAQMYVRSAGGEPEQMEQILADMAPQLFDSLRSYLQVSVEQRAQARRIFTDPVRAYPVLPELDLAACIEGFGRNISCGGISFLLPELPPSDKIYLHFPECRRAANFAILAQLTRRQPMGDDGFEFGAFFPGTASLRKDEG